MNLEFEDIVVKVKKNIVKAQYTTVIHGVSGCFRSGELSAIMGPSGAGKSTLLNTLSGFRTEKTKGNIKINGMPVDKKFFQKASRYIIQEDLLPLQLTVQEAMEFAASLKLPISTSYKQRLGAIMEILGNLGLSESVDTRTEKLSGGQKKRLSIALEMINNPVVFFLDEPTTGLDNVSTMQSLDIFRKLSRQGRTIICTIHQPSASLFSMFDHVYVLGRGRCVYQGSTTQLVPFLSSVGFRCPISYNPADYVIEVVEADEANLILLAESVKNSNIETTVKPKLTQMQIDEHLSSTLDYPVNTFRQFYLILMNMWRETWRNKLTLYTQFFHHLLCGVLISTFFYNKMNDGELWLVHLKFNVCYVIFLSYTHVMINILTFPLQVEHIHKEHFNRWYSLPAYFYAALFSKIPLQLILGLVFTTIVYFVTGLPPQLWRFLYFYTGGMLVTLASDAMGMAVGTSCSITSGSIIGALLISANLGLGIFGFDYARDIPWVMNEMMKLSFIRDGLVASDIATHGFDRPPFECDYIFCYFQSPKEVLYFMDLHNASVWTQYGYIFGLFVFFRTFSYFALKRKLNI